MNLYGYVGNNPQNFVDPSGLQIGHSDLYGDREFWEKRRKENIESGKRRTQYEYEAGYLPENFQCGPSPFTDIGFLGRSDVIQKPHGYNFKDGPCFNHDACYQKCGSDKSQCDENFGSELNTECESKGNFLERNLCKANAYLFYRLVKSDTFGKPAYDECQLHEGCNVNQ